MASTNKDPVLVILQLTGANDYLNTIVPYTNPLYWDNRPKVNIPADQVVPIDDELAFRSDMDQFKAIYLVRDPVHRIVADYAHRFSVGQETRSWPEFVDSLESSAHLDRSRYFSQLQPYLERFPPQSYGLGLLKIV